MFCSTIGVYIFLCVAFVEVFGVHLQLTDLIEKIHMESDSATVFFFGIENEIVSNFIKKRPDVAVTFFTSHSQPSKDDNHQQFISNALFVVQTSCLKCDMLDFSIRKLNSRKFLIINANNSKDLEESFSYFFKEKKFTRLFGIARGVACAYLPFADIQVVELKIDQTEPVPNALKDLNRYAIRTVAREDLPRIFWVTDKRGERQIAGYIGKLFKAFVEKHNALFTLIDVENLDKYFMMAVVNATIKNELDISINVYQHLEGIQLSYPLKLMSWLIVAPIIGHLNPNQYFLRPFSLTVWIAVGVCTFYIIVMDMVRNKLCGKPVRVWESFSQNCLIILARPTERPLTSAYRFHSQVFLFSFVLVNIYLVYLTSFLTVFIKVKQHKTIQDLIDHQVPLLIVDYEWKFVSADHVPDLVKIVQLMHYDEILKKRYSMENTNFAHALGRDKAKFFIDLQRHPRHHIIYDSLKDYYLGFVMEKHSHFSGILNDFIFVISDRGLMQKWYRDGIALIKEHKLLVLDTTANHSNHPYPLSMFHLTFAWVCLINGLIIAVLIFIVEVFLHRRRSRRGTRKLKLKT